MKDLKTVLGTAGVETEETDEKDPTDLIAESMTARGKQPNIAFFAFTATPKPKTLELLGHAQFSSGNSL